MRVLVLRLVALILLLGCAPSTERPYSEPSGARIEIHTQEEYHANDKISYTLRLNFDNDSIFFYPCVDSLAVWETLKRDRDVCPSLAFQSDVGGSREGVPSAPCKTSPTRIRNMRAVVFEIPLNYQMEGQPSTRLYEMPEGKYELSVRYTPELALAIEGGEEHTDQPFRSLRNNVFGAEKGWESNVVKFRVIPVVRKK